MYDIGLKVSKMMVADAKVSRNVYGCFANVVDEGLLKKDGRRRQSMQVKENRLDDLQLSTEAERMRWHFLPLQDD